MFSRRGGGEKEGKKLLLILSVKKKGCEKERSSPLLMSRGGKGRTNVGLVEGEKRGEVSNPINPMKKKEATYDVLRSQRERRLGCVANSHK